ncbi:hypothetical protein EVAR_48220_1 [Eumeta japonica]|uniref:Uncharacterized protein n=1 Tax=Eumeta variegata TaxID=151549 RepID=A0A4C1YCR3_EUMVA|nr:hypothetical protein EVAR_48220_1 [Eumeta japonica]
MHGGRRAADGGRRAVGREDLNLVCALNILDILIFRPFEARVVFRATRHDGYRGEGLPLILDEILWARVGCHAQAAGDERGAGRGARVTLLRSLLSLNALCQIKA